MMNLSVLTVKTLKEVAKVLGVTGFSTMKKDELISAVAPSFKTLDVIAKHNRLDWTFCSFGTQYVEAEEIKNSRVLPAGAIVGYPINEKNGMLCGMHYEYLYADKLDVADDCVGFNLTDNARVFVVDNATDFEVLYAIAGEHMDDQELELEAQLRKVGSDIEVTKFLNWENASKYFDAVLFTQNVVDELHFANCSHNLGLMDYETVVILNNDAVAEQACFEMVETNGTALTDIVDKKKEANKAERIIKTQYRIVKHSIDDLVWEPILKRYVIPAEKELEKTAIPMSDNRLFRWFHDTVTEEVDGVTIERRVVPDFVIFNAVPAKQTPETQEKVKAVLANGYVDLSKHMVTGVSNYNRVMQVTLQSASQARQGKYYFSSLDRDMVRGKLSYAADFGNEVEIAKVEARIALGTSSSTPVGFGFTSTVIADRSYTAQRTVQVFDGTKILRIKKDLTLTPTDGMGTIEVKPSAVWAQKLGLISKRELDFFLNNFTSLEDLGQMRGAEESENLSAEDNKSIRVANRLLKILAKIPNAFQVRHGGDKGLLVMYPHSNYGYTSDIVMCQSMHKYETPDGVEVEWEVCNYNKPKKDMVYLSYQFIQSLDITAEDLITLSQRAIDKVEKNVMTDANVAMKFLGMIYNIGDESDSDDDVLVSKITKILATDAGMINDKKVQVTLKNLVEKFLIELSLGRTPIQGKYVYIACDPRFMLGADEKDCLQSQQNYLNGVVDEFVGMRSPMIHSSEIAWLPTVDDKALWFMVNILVLNPFDDSLPRMGGADCDGDAILITNEEIIKKSAPRGLDMLYDEGRKAPKKANTWENRVAHFCRTAKVSQVGDITNQASIKRDLSLHNGDPKKYDVEVKAFRFYQGWEIDSAKTGVEVKVPNHLKTKAVPHWMIANKKYKNRPISDKAEVYVSNSPLGKNYDFVSEFIKKFQITVQPEDKTLLFLKNVDNGEAVRISAMVKAYEKQYCREIRAIMNKYTSNTTVDKDSRYEAIERYRASQENDEFSKERSAEMQEVFAKYHALLHSLSDDECAVAYAAYNAAYNKKDNESKSYSLPWTCCFNGMLQLLHMNNNATMLVKLPKSDETPDTVVVNNNGVLYINDVPKKVVNYKPGVYEIIKLEDAYYIAVERKALIQVDDSELKPVRYISKRLYQFSVNGYYWHLGLKAQDVVETIKTNNNEFSVIGVNNRTMIVAGGKVVAYFNSADNALLPNVVNVKFNMFEHEELIYIPQRKTAKTVMLDDKYAMKNSFCITAIPSGVVTEDELKAFAQAEGVTVSDDFAPVEITEYVEDSNVVYTSEPSVVIVEETPAIVEEAGVSVDDSSMVIEEVGAVVVEEVEETVKPEVMAKLNLNANYWTVKDITKPANVDRYTVAITNYQDFAKGQQIGIVTAYKGETGYVFSVHVNEQGNGLTIKADVEVTAQFYNWVLRIVSYKAMEMRMGLN